ncbi:MAG: hypothetical protein WA656_21400 [Pseudolabrys sp.]
MAKKKSTAKRSTKASKRRLSTKRVAAKGKGRAFQSGAFQGLPPSASQRKLSPAVQSTVGEVSPSPALLGISTTSPEIIVIPAPIPITPTVYPDSPQGTVIVENYITINAQSVQNFNIQMDALVKQLQFGGSNEISGDVCAQILSEITAGRALLEGPNPSRDLIDLLLVRPLKYLAEKAAGAIIGTLAGQALVALLKMMM